MIQVNYMILSVGFAFLFGVIIGWLYFKSDIEFFKKQAESYHSLYRVQLGLNEKILKRFNRDEEGEEWKRI